MSETNFRHPDALVSTDWLEANLGDPALRVFDCTTYLVYDTGPDKPYRCA
jgi:thiosulfate/3-mercaptopyruvate sulfurtransferase